MSENGIMVDTVARCHRKSYGTEGKQPILFPSEDVSFDLYVWAAVMICPHRYPKNEDFPTLPKLTIT